MIKGPGICAAILGAFIFTLYNRPEAPANSKASTRTPSFRTDVNSINPTSREPQEREIKELEKHQAAMTLPHDHPLSLSTKDGKIIVFSNQAETVLIKTISYWSDILKVLPDEKSQISSDDKLEILLSAMRDFALLENIPGLTVNAKPVLTDQARLELMPDQVPSVEFVITRPYQLHQQSFQLMARAVFKVLEAENYTNESEDGAPLDNQEGPIFEENQNDLFRLFFSRVRSQIDTTDISDRIKNLWRIELSTRHPLSLPSFFNFRWLPDSTRADRAKVLIGRVVLPQPVLLVDGAEIKTDWFDLHYLKSGIELRFPAPGVRLTENNLMFYYVEEINP